MHIKQLHIIQILFLFNLNKSIKLSSKQLYPKQRQNQFEIFYLKIQVLFIYWNTTKTKSFDIIYRQTQVFSILCQNHDSK